MLFTPLLAVWFAITSPHFELITDADQKSGRQVLADLENARLALAGPFGTPLPVRCFLFRNQEDFAAYQPTPITRAFFQSGPDRDYIVAVLDSNGKVPRQNLLHEYVHLYLHHSTARLPKWTDEGLAEYYSTMEFANGRAKVGLPATRHEPVLAQGGQGSGPGELLSAAEMAAVTQDSAEYTDGPSAMKFYAQAWAAMYTFASQHSGRPPLEAAELSPERLSGYLATYRATRVKAPVFSWPMDQSVDLGDAHLIAETEAALLQADLLMRLGKRERARKLLEQLEGRVPQASTIERGLALVAADRGDAAEAERRFERALETPDADADAFFEYAVYLENARASRDRVNELLAEATKRNPNHAEAQFLQGRLLARTGRHAEALAYYERAMRILPREAIFSAGWEASKEALRARPDPIKRDDVRVPASWNAPAGDARFTGTLERVDCQGNAATLLVRQANRTRTFQVRAADRVQIRGANGIQAELACGTQRAAVTVEVEYLESTGAVSALTFSR